MTTKHFETKEQYLNFRSVWAKAAQDGKLTAAHMMMYNAIRGKDIYHGFTPVTNHNKLMNGMPLNQGLRAAHEEFQRIVQWSQSDNNKWRDKWVADFIAPFEGALTRDDLQRIDVPEKVETLWADYGKGGRIAKKILAGAKPTTFDELFALDVEEAA